MADVSAAWFDGHLDLACLALEGRDLRATLADATGPPQPASVTLPGLRAGRVTHCLATLFTGLGTEGPCGYASTSDLEAPHASARSQLEVYTALERGKELRVIRSSPELAEAIDVMPRAIILMEGADPILDEADAAWWFEQGVRVVGLTWARGTRYAGGNANPGPLTDAGRRLVAAFDELGIIHDLSHLADEAAWQVLKLAKGPVVASHSNCRAICLGHSERNLPDDLIRAIGARGGMIGLNLFSLFLSPQGASRRATLSEAIAHVEHVAQITGRTDIIGLGSDMDGGFGADRLPEGINAPADLPRLTESLLKRGWSDSEVSGFRSDNWMRFLRRALPR